MKPSFNLFAFFFLTIFCARSECFIPAKVMSSVIYKLESGFQSDLGKVSESLVHDEIMKRGLIQSVVKYFSEQPKSTNRVNISKINNEYYDLRVLYYDYYGKGLCNSDIPLVNLIRYKFQPAVASVDFLSSLKDLPYAHFDAETFTESNERVINVKNEINYELGQQNYDEAREKTGQVLHTIQDFYAHSNWVEMGNTVIQPDIGTTAFNDLVWVSANDSELCSNDTANCQLIEEECTFWVNLFAALINGIGLGGEFVKCPLQYYKCTDNILMLDKLVSGYYTGQKLPGGIEYNKPVGLGKCSHGGILDGSSFIRAEGGINKDSGYTVFSPHADLHLAAATLAINHTQMFFDEIRGRIGDAEFNKFLELNIDEASLGVLSDTSCVGSKINSNYFISFSVLFLVALMF